MSSKVSAQINPATPGTLTSVRRGRPRRSEEADRRQSILVHAADAFSTNGFQGTSIEAVARQAGVSKATIYSQFGSKDGLFKAIAEQICAPSASTLAAIVVEGRCAEDVLTEIARSLLDKLGDERAFRLLRLSIFEQERFPDSARAIYEVSLSTLAPLVGCMRQLIEAGQIEPADPAELAVAFFALVMRGHRFLLVPGSDAQQGEDGFVQRVVRLFLFGASGNRTA